MTNGIEKTDCPEEFLIHDTRFKLLNAIEGLEALHIEGDSTPPDARSSHNGYLSAARAAIGVALVDLEQAARLHAEIAHGLKQVRPGDPFLPW